MIKVIACAIYKPYIALLDIDFSKYEIKYLEVHQHNQPKQLSKNIQKEINQTKDVEKIILLYGLCGNALLDIEVKDNGIDVIAVHDCLSVLLGSKERYKKLFKERLSSSWSCYGLKQSGYQSNDSEVYQLWMQEYDEETAEYLRQYLLIEQEVYISFDLEQEQKYVKEDKEIIIGDLKFLEAVLLGKSKDVLSLKKGDKISNSYNFDEVFKKG